MGVFIISDVIGDDISVIASGPTVPDATTPDDALNVLKKYHLTDMIPGCITDYLRNKDLQNCKPRKGDRCFDKITNHIIANNASALAAAKTTAEELGYETQIVSAAIHGEAREAAAQWAAIAKKQKGKTCLLAGGETTVTIKGNGNGGRNQEFALAALAALQNEPGVVIASAGSDGTDGPTEVAGAIVSADTFLKASALNLDINAFLSGNDSYHFFERTGGHIVTGPTQTNVMDIIIALIDW